MDTRSGRLMDMDEVNKLPPLEQANFVPVKRDLTKKEASDKQIKLYSPCACGSGKNFKFCHYKP